MMQVLRHGDRPVATARYMYCLLSPTTYLVTYLGTQLPRYPGTLQGSRAVDTWAAGSPCNGTSTDSNLGRERRR